MMHNFLQAAREAGMTMQEYRSSSDRIFKAMTESCERYELDGILLDVDTALLASACGASVRYPPDIAAVTEDRQPRSIRQLLDALPEVDLTKSDRIKLYLEAAEKLAVWCHKNGVYMRANADQGAFSLACLLVGMNEFLTDLLDEDCEEDLHALMEQTYRISLQMHRLCFATGADGTSYGNSSEGCSVVSPNIFRRFGKTLETRLAAELKRDGIPTICHICGRVTPILSDLTQTGCPAYEMDASTDILAAKEIGRGHFIISGNLDPALLCVGKPERIAAETQSLCELFKGEGGLIICSGCAVSPLTPRENIEAAVRVVREHG